MSDMPVQLIPHPTVNVRWTLGLNQDHIAVIHYALTELRKNGTFPSYEQPLEALIEGMERNMYTYYRAEPFSSRSPAGETDA